MVPPVVQGGLLGETHTGLELVLMVLADLSMLPANSWPMMAGCPPHPDGPVYARVPRMAQFCRWNYRRSRK